MFAIIWVQINMENVFFAVLLVSCSLFFTWSIDEIQKQNVLLMQISHFQ